MDIIRIALGPIQTNCYIIVSGRDAAIIDPGDYSSAMADYIKKNDLRVRYILLTHGHFDHTYGAERFARRFDSKIVIGEDDEIMLHDPEMNGSAMFGTEFKNVKADVTVKDDDVIKLGNTSCTVLYTPGHTPGGVAYYFAEEKALFSGDTLFRGSIGRTDMYGGSMEELGNSIVNKLYKLPDDTMVYPGHMEYTTIGEEKLHNMFFRA